jgi:hypothetical protein
VSLLLLLLLLLDDKEKKISRKNTFLLLEMENSFLKIKSLQKIKNRTKCLFLAQSKSVKVSVYQIVAVDEVRVSRAESIVPMLVVIVCDDVSLFRAMWCGENSFWASLSARDETCVNRARSGACWPTLKPAKNRLACDLIFTSLRLVYEKTARREARRTPSSLY